MSISDNSEMFFPSILKYSASFFKRVPSQISQLILFVNPSTHLLIAGEGFSSACREM